MLCHIWWRDERLTWRKPRALTSDMADSATPPILTQQWYITAHGAVHFDTKRRPHSWPMLLLRRGRWRDLVGSVKSPAPTAVRSCAIGWLLASVLEWCKAAAVRRCAACLPACAAGSGHVPLATGRRTGWEIRNGWWTWWFIAIHAYPRCCYEETVGLGFHFTLFSLFLFAVQFRWKKPAKARHCYTMNGWGSEKVASGAEILLCG